MGAAAKTLNSIDGARRQSLESLTIEPAIVSDELGENLTVVVDGIDGRTHHVAGIDPARVEDARIGSVVEISLADTAQRPSDRTIVAIAEDGVYRPSRHLEHEKFEGAFRAATMRVMSMPMCAGWGVAPGRHR